jgi:hypothetical protein
MDENLKLAVYNKFREIGQRDALLKLADITDSVSSAVSTAKDVKNTYENAPSLAKSTINSAIGLGADALGETDISPEQKQVVNKIKDRVTSRHPFIDTAMQDVLDIQPEPDSIQGTAGMAFDAVDRFGGKIPVMGEPLSGMAYFTKNYATPTARKIEQQINPFENPHRFESQIYNSKGNNQDRDEVRNTVNTMQQHSRNRADEVDAYRQQAMEMGQSGEQGLATGRRMQRINDERAEDDRLYNELGPEGYRAEMERRNNLSNQRYNGSVQTSEPLQRPAPARPAPAPARPAPAPARPAPAPARPAPAPARPANINKHTRRAYELYNQGKIHPSVISPEVQAKFDYLKSKGY